MRFISTRGRAPPATLEAAITAGYAPDGGLYVPETLPKIDAATLDAWATLDFASLAVEVLWPFAEADVARADFEALLRPCYAGRRAEWYFLGARRGGLMHARVEGRQRTHAGTRART